ncbi:competence/damage-inducible protein A [Candidatus Bathyarchaeota archaeon]|nr:competence/damage-inducible protein A [Candidatus Bathyarchaeota archaeon]
MTFNIEIIAVGEEILKGRIVDTNSPWIVAQATSAGANITRITCVGDNLSDIEAVIRDAIQRGVDLVVTVGGLGPTPDDRTLEGIAKATGRQFRLDERILRILERKYNEFAQQRGIKLTPEMLEGQRKMAFTAEGSEPIENPLGTAPGIKLQVNKTMIISLPGVPAEMKAIFERSLLPLIRSKTKKCSLVKTVRVKMFESELISVLQEVTKAYPQTYLKSYAVDPTAHRREIGLKVDIIAESETEEKCREILEGAFQKLKALVEERGSKITLE